MSRVEILVATMNQSDFSLYEKMNIQTDAVIANQTDKYSFEEKIIEDNNVKLVSTADRGVGKNRNIALINASGEILLMADDDCVYIDGYENIITDAFDKMSRADIILFGLSFDDSKNRTVKKITKVNKYNCLSYGAPRIAVRKESLQKANVFFSHLYGGGAKYSSGEDNLFIKECIDKKMKIYAYPATIAHIGENPSTWFSGYNDKYFFDKGFLLANAYPCAAKLFCIILAYKLRKKSVDYNFKKVKKLMFKGVKAFKQKGLKIYE